MSFFCGIVVARTYNYNLIFQINREDLSHIDQAQVMLTIINPRGEYYNAMRYCQITDVQVGQATIIYRVEPHDFPEAGTYILEMRVYEHDTVEYLRCQLLVIDGETTELNYGPLHPYERTLIQNYIMPETSKTKRKLYQELKKYT